MRAGRRQGGGDFYVAILLSWERVLENPDTHGARFLKTRTGFLKIQ